MSTLLRIAWRNLWRGWRRSAIVVSAITVGLAACLLMIAWSHGWLEQIVQTAVGTRLGLVAVHAEGYQANPDVDRAARRRRPRAGRGGRALPRRARVAARSRRRLDPERAAERAGRAGRRRPGARGARLGRGALVRRGSVPGAERAGRAQPARARARRGARRAAPREARRQARGARAGRSGARRVPRRGHLRDRLDGLRQDRRVPAPRRRAAPVRAGRPGERDRLRARRQAQRAGVPRLREGRAAEGRGPTSGSRCCRGSSASRGSRRCSG